MAIRLHPTKFFSQTLYLGLEQSNFSFELLDFAVRRFGSAHT